MTPVQERETYSCYVTTSTFPRNTRTQMYADRVACCPLVSHAEYAPRALLRLEKDGVDGQTDARPLYYAYC